MSLYKRWDRNEFDTKVSHRGKFLERLLAGEVSEFDITQCGNAYCTYSRCLYKVRGSHEVFMEVPLERPGIVWLSENERKYNANETVAWQFIHNHFKRSLEYFCVRFVSRSRQGHHPDGQDPSGGAQHDAERLQESGAGAQRAVGQPPDEPQAQAGQDHPPQLLDHR